MRRSSLNASLLRLSLVGMLLLIGGLAVAVPARAQQRDPATEITAEKADGLWSDARNAMQRRDYTTAIALYTRLASTTGHGYQEDAHEFLGVARERTGQLAQARLAYETYLDAFPRGRHRGRVEQRLAVLLGSEPRRETKAPVAETPTTPTAASWQHRISLSQTYRYRSSEFDGETSTIDQSTLDTGLHVDSRREGERFDTAFRLTTAQMLDFQSGDDATGDLSRFSYLYGEVEDTVTRIRLRAGRQSGNRLGILGKFDGLLASAPVGRSLQVNLFAGSPVDSSRDGLDTERQLQGVSIDLGPWHDTLDMSVYHLQQSIGGLTDRSATGAIVRYHDTKRSLVGMIDYDDAFSELSRAALLANSRVSESLTLYGRFNLSRSPFLSLRNAVIGQGTLDFDSLEAQYSEAELRQFALDRSPPTRSTSFGLSKELSEMLTGSVGVTLTHTNASPAGGSVAAREPSDSRDVHVTVSKSSLLKEHDLANTTVRFYDHDTVNGTALLLNYRIPANERLRINPILRVDLRDDDNQGSRTLMSGSLRLEHRWSERVTLEAELGTERSSIDSDVSPNEHAINFFSLGYRYTPRLR